MKIVVNTPAGNIGRRIVDQLLESKHEVSIISRHPSKVTDFIKRGAQLNEGSIDSPSVLDAAFKDADALLWLTPFAFDQPDYLAWARKTGAIGAMSAKHHGIQRVVLISSVGAQHDRGVGPIGCLPAIETAFAAAVPHVATLRAGSFMENYLQSVSSIAASGTIFGPHLAHKKIPMVATRDIAAKASELLQAKSWTGFRIVGVHGPEVLDQLQAAALISEGLGRPVKYVEVSITQAKQGMSGSGLPHHIVDLLPSPA
jgi:uncharacterized protein YbjT (DUF2867 family)